LDGINNSKLLAYEQPDYLHSRFPNAWVCDVDGKQDRKVNTKEQPKKLLFFFKIKAPDQE
jgi:hypothetical protein